MNYQTINGDKWLFFRRENTNAKGVPMIDIAGTLIKGQREFLILAGYPKAQESIYKNQIEKNIASVKIK